MRLTQEQRARVRAAICKDYRWDEYRRNNGNINSSQLDRERILAIANEWELDLPAIAGPAFSTAAEIAAAKSSNNAAGSNGVHRTDGYSNVVSTNDVDADAEYKAWQAFKQTIRPTLDMEQIEELINAKVAEAVAALPQSTTIIELHSDDRETVRIEGAHPQLADLIRVMRCRQANGFPPNVWLSGPTGSGKTHAAHMTADALGVQFFKMGGLSMEHQLVGHVDANGNYHTTPFREAYQNGGLIILDECDTYSEEVSLVANGALDNGSFTFPDSPIPVQRHKDFYVIAAGNTFGNGATSTFVGRNKLDGAFMSRFPVCIYWQYDADLEARVCGNAEWARRVQSARKAAANIMGTPVIIDPRHSNAGAALIANGFSMDDAAKLTYLSRLTPEQASIIEGGRV